ncbi:MULTISPECIES: hypothetical protein [Psychrilyobacter]|uniref:Uncharacterized protein n=1 Tax=Psychrilyobacter piezotolerans TaxID=2293438 RepID=A0ABX9KDB1_9FUSO|nr:MULTISPECIES: hypothetical protein [Psychrilyobacter]MCS5423236.1 hypothetical protein [Psychrilyobacter sp. S5]NDI78189.1 hypothetical protein [Psychrilyobacter piezotolerans]RDE58956.1 hypothetical protein DV867_14480 [Psychrilyobacter sp. S5]REI39515.1 hypothetical protein DYH56_14480 [Psychrilyobacter piezotolerans]
MNKDIGVTRIDEIESLTATGNFKLLDAYIDGNLNKEIYTKRIEILEEEIIIMEKKVILKMNLR